VNGVIVLDRVSKTYRGSLFSAAREAVRELSLEVGEGEVFGFVGPNGAGKSTTIKMLLGLIRPGAGSVRLFGRPADDPEARVGLGYVMENPSLPEFLTPLELLRAALALRGQARGVDERCRHWLERLGIAEAAGRRIGSFSKGMVQRTALAQALAIDPRLLVLDEPLSGLDPVGRRDVVEILAEFKQQGGSVFLTSHVLHDVERLADRFGLIHQGELRAVRSPAELVGRDEHLVVRSLGRQGIAGMQPESSGRWFGEVPRGELWALLDRLREAGHELIEVRPALSLEAAFMQSIQPAERGG
jgi:ABC-2 type transport system ATP-binding protein